MRRIDPSPSQDVRLADTFSFTPPVWRDPGQKGNVPDLALPLPNPAELHVHPSSTCENDSQVSNKNETARTRDTPLWKHILDITCALVSLPIWLPILVCVALWIKIASPGPIFFRQERVGYRGRHFMMLKFRTMKVNVETQSHERHLEQLIHADCPMTKLDAAGDPRIISGGTILRATGLDELPQLFNVLRREMSLVGPRPCTPHEFQRYQPWQQERVNAAPGLTGPETEVGVVGWTPSGYQALPWRRSSDRAKELLTETAGYIFEALLNSGRSSWSSHPELPIQQALTNGPKTSGIIANHP